MLDQANTSVGAFLRQRVIILTAPPERLPHFRKSPPGIRLQHIGTLQGVGHRFGKGLTTQYRYLLLAIDGQAQLVEIPEPTVRHIVAAPTEERIVPGSPEPVSQKRSSANAGVLGQTTLAILKLFNDDRSLRLTTTQAFDRLADENLINIARISTSNVSMSMHRLAKNGLLRQLPVTVPAPGGRASQHLFTAPALAPANP